MIHTFGDSHSCWNIAGVYVHHIGPVLCYSFGHGTSNRNISSYNIKSGDSVIFCFGEIDCRCHVHKHIIEKTYEDIIDEIVDKYFDAIRENIFQFSNLKTFVYNVVPPVQKHNTAENKEYPYRGSDEERKQYVLYFNQRLKKKSTESGFIFFDVHDKYVDENGFLNKLFSDGHVHIKNEIFIKEFLEANK